MFAYSLLGLEFLRAKICPIKIEYEKFPVCIAKTQYSFTADPEDGGLPQEHLLPVKEIRISAGAEFVVVICGDIMLMPGLPRIPAAESIFIDDKGLIQGLF